MSNSADIWKVVTQSRHYSHTAHLQTFKNAKHYITSASGLGPSFQKKWWFFFSKIHDLSSVLILADIKQK